jgi:hypothetical protein
MQYQISFDTATVEGLDPRGRQDAVRGDRAGRHRHVPVLRRTGAARSSPRRRFPCRSSASSPS